MTTRRREFLQTAAAAAGALSLGAVPSPAAEPRVPNSQEPLRILILGGTGFIGPHEISYALARGHQVTIFNRGRSQPSLFPELYSRVEWLKGDRNGDFAALEGREWDAVIDNAAMIPRWVRESAGLLKDAASQYLYISTLSVYGSFPDPGMDETWPVATIDDPTAEEVNGRTYGPLKALCEQEAEKAFPDRATVVRPGLIVGPGDPTDRWTYWPVRINRGGEVLAPGDPGTLVRFIDVRDLTEWAIRLLEQQTPGVFNAVGPRSHLSIAEMLYGIRATTSDAVSFTWVDTDFLFEHDVRPWADMPAWLPPRDGYEGYGSISRDRAIAAGLSFRPLAVTATDTVDWWMSLPEERRQSPKAGLTPEREAEVLAAWDARAESDQ
ncbi:MAG: hypothetical protein AMS21_08040 [Gemmatimonas sp. SG8_38_2]|nr:MAG: hypothetical protein AMS21_08040 [Gemmatimonas sp. SG8_38_2]